MTDHVYQQLREQLAYLKLGAVAEQLAAALQHAETDKPSYTRFLHQLLSVEITATEQRRLDGRLRFASFPQHKTLEQFDYDAQPGLDRRLVDELATLGFIEEKANVLLIGPPGVGKTMLATALGLKAVQADYRVYYTTVADLVARTTRAAIEGRWQTTMRFWNGPAVLVIDELGLSADARRGRQAPLPGDLASLPARLRDPDHQPRDRAMGRDLRRHHRRRRDPRPPAASRDRAAHERNAGAYRLTVRCRARARVVVGRRQVGRRVAGS